MISTRHLPLFLLALVVAFAPSALADTYLAYSQGGIPPGSDIYTWSSSCDAGACDFIGIDTCDTPEGGTSLRMRDPVYGGFGVFHLAPLYRDLSAFENGELRFFLKTPNDVGGRADPSVVLKCDPGTGSADQLLDFNSDGISDDLTAWGYNPTSDDWQAISIPICDFFGGTCDATAIQCLQNVESPFVFNLRTNPIGRVTVQADYMRWVTPTSHSGASQVTTNGRQLEVNGKPFSVNGMAYAPLSVGENWQGAWRDRPDRYETDFPLIAASGANTVRLYAPILSSNMLDKAWEAGLFVIPTFGVDDFQLSCAAGRAQMQDRFVETVTEWGDHPAILFWLVGNEVETYLVQSNLDTDFFPQLDALAAAAAAAEGASAHPVGTAMADLLDVCKAGISDDTALPNVDLWGTQLYRGCTFGTAFNDYNNKADCARPLVVTEFGADSFNSASQCSGGPPTSCFVNTDCPQDVCSTTTTINCNLDTDCPVGTCSVTVATPCRVNADCPGTETCNGGETCGPTAQFCDGEGSEDQAMQASCMASLLSDAEAGLAIKAGGVSAGQVVFAWLDEWWKAACLPTGGWPFHDTCANTRNDNYGMDPAINEEWFGVVANESFCSTTTTTPCQQDADCPGTETCSTISNPDARVNKAAYADVGDSWLGAVCNLDVLSHDPGTGSTDIAFSPAAGNALDHTLYYGPLSNVSTYTTTASTSVGTLGSSTVTLPGGSLFMLVAAENANALEGCAGTNSAGAERPCLSGTCAAGWNCLCSSP